MTDEEKIVAAMEAAVTHGPLCTADRIVAAGLAELLRLMRETGLAAPDGWYVDETVYRDAAGGRVLVQRDGRCSAWIYTESVGMFDTLAEAIAAVEKARHADR